MTTRPDIHTNPATGEQFLVGPKGQLVPYSPGSGLPDPTPQPLENTQPKPTPEEVTALSWSEQRALAQSLGLGDKPDGVTWEEFVLQNL